jgi:hypothetical protein
MPMVGKKEFTYGPKGIAIGNQQAKKTGKKMVIKKMGKKK